jgi:PilZ domain
LHAISTNVSEGGIALLMREALPKGATPHLHFSLPGIDLPMDVEAEVAWADMKGLAGLRFRNVPKATQDQIEQWLDARIEEEFPGTKERIAGSKSQSPS